MGWGNLRVINEDRIAPGTGFGTHGHRDMEIISYVLSGELAHKDTHGQRQGHPARRRAAHERRPRRDAQRVQPRAGPDHALPADLDRAERHRHRAGYEQKTLRRPEKRGKLRLVASPDGAEGSVKINADARLYAGLFDGAESADAATGSGRKGYVHLVRGELRSTASRWQAATPPSCRAKPAVHAAERQGRRSAGVRPRPSPDPPAIPVPVPVTKQSRKEFPMATLAPATTLRHHRRHRVAPRRTCH
jgi:hypothetical protein